MIRSTRLNAWRRDHGNGTAPRRTLAGNRTFASSAAAADFPRRASAGGQSSGPAWNPLCQPYRRSLADAAARGLRRQRLIVLAAPAGMDPSRNLATVAQTSAQSAGQIRWRVAGACRGRQPVGPRFKGGPHTGPNPVDRAKPGCKRHLLTDVEGVPLVVQTTAANVPDQEQLPSLLEAMPAVQGPRGRPRRKPGSIFGDRAYGTAEMIALVTLMGIFSFLAPRADDTHGSGLGTFRYVVERTLACFSQFRRLKMCYERTPEHFQALHEIAACCLVATRLKWYEV